MEYTDTVQDIPVIAVLQRCSDTVQSTLVSDPKANTQTGMYQWLLSVFPWWFTLVLHAMFCGNANIPQRAVKLDDVLGPSSLMEPVDVLQTKT